MKLDLIGMRIAKCDFINDMAPNSKLNIQVSISNQIKLPRQLTPRSVGTISTKIMVGSPMAPLYMFFEQICNFADVEAGDQLTYDNEELMSMYKTICVPVATKKAEETLGKLCASYNIPPIDLQNRVENNNYN